MHVGSTALNSAIRLTPLTLVITNLCSWVFLSPVSFASLPFIYFIGFYKSRMGKEDLKRKYEEKKPKPVFILKG